MSPWGPEFSSAFRATGVTAAIAGEAKARERQGDRGQHGELDLAGFDLLAEVLGRAADHEAGHEDRQQSHHHHPA